MEQIKNNVNKLLLGLRLNRATPGQFSLGDMHFDHAAKLHCHAIKPKSGLVQCGRRDRPTAASPFAVSLKVSPFLST